MVLARAGICEIPTTQYRPVLKGFETVHAVTCRAVLAVDYAVPPRFEGV